MQQGRFVARTIRDACNGKPSGKFAYFDKGSMATIGRSRAIAQVGKLKLSGFIAWMAWLVVHIFYLINFRNRLVVLFDWMHSYFAYERGSRLITGRRLDAGAPPGKASGPARRSARSLMKSLALLGLLALSACSAASKSGLREVADGTWEVECGSLGSCAEQAERACRSRGYDIIGGYERSELYGHEAGESQVAVRKSQLIVVCRAANGDSRVPPSSASPAPLSPAAASPAPAAAKLLCTPGATQRCVGKGACDGGQELPAGRLRLRGLRVRRGTHPLRAPARLRAPLPPRRATDRSFGF